MQIDLQTTFSGATAVDGTKTAQGPITATQLSTNVIDLRPVSGLPLNADEGIEGTDLYLNVRTIQAFNNLTSLTITLESDSTSNIATAPVVHYGVTIPLASLGANPHHHESTPMPTSQFSRKNQFANINQSYDGLSPFTPSDAIDVPIGPGGNSTPCVGVWVQGAGNVAVQLTSGGTATLTGLAAGQIVDCGISRILATGTTATGVVPLYGERG